LEEEQEADEEFWGQEFFKEDDTDIPYLTESDKESVADSDFSDTDAESDGNSETEEPLEKPKKKRLLPPGTLPKRPKAKQKKLKTVVSEVQQKVKTEPQPEKSQELTEGTSVSLRQSTLLRRTAAEEERRLNEMQRIKRQVKVTDRVLSVGMEEFLKEVAETEVYNLASLNELQAFEEESKKRALQTKARRKVPSVTIRSRKVGDSEKTVMELTHMKRLPTWMRPQEKLIEPVPQKCVVTGLPAKYRDPLTKLPYATVEAFKEIRKRSMGHKPN